MKKITLEQSYPNICSNVSMNNTRCSNGVVDPYTYKRKTLNDTLLNFQLYKYAKENLVMLNIYIKVNFNWTKEIC